MLNENGAVGQCMNYETREDPFDETSPGVKVPLNRLTGKMSFITNIKENSS